MARFTVRWLELAREQYDALPQGERHAVDTRLADLCERPHGSAGSYDPRRDQWTATYGDGVGLLLYAISVEQRRVLVLRLVAIS